jgi:phospho-N-acetylmuramoyl-pentapeptide-transferase
MPFIQTVRDLALSVFVGGIAASSWVVPMTDLLYKFHFTAKHMLTGDKMNAEFVKLHAHKSGTPSLGGILIWITVPVVLLTLFPRIPFISATAFIFFIVGLYGFLDGLYDMAIKNNLKMREMSAKFEWKMLKLLVTYVLSIAVAYAIVFIAGVTSVNVFGFIMPLNTPLGILLVSMFALVSMNATDIIDGLDALAAGMYVITLIGFILLVLALPANFALPMNVGMGSIIGVVIGVLFVYLYFNIPPARFFMGAPGAMIFGPFFLLLALYGNIFPAFLVFMIIYYVDFASSTLQLFSLKFFKKRIFRIAPIHHHFESLGWPDYKVVMRFWLFNWGVIFLGILIQLFLNSK